MHDLSTREITGLVRIHMTACSVEDAVKELERVCTDGELEELSRTAEGLKGLFNAVVERCGDEDRQVMIRNRAASLKVKVGYADTPQQGKYVYMCWFLAATNQFETPSGRVWDVGDVTHWMPIPEPPKEG